MERDRRSMCSSTGLVLLFFWGCVAFFWWILFLLAPFVGGFFLCGCICGPFGPSVHWYFSLLVCLSSALLLCLACLSLACSSGPPDSVSSRRRSPPRSPLHQPTQPFCTLVCLVPPALSLASALSPLLPFPFLPLAPSPTIAMVAINTNTLSRSSFVLLHSCRASFVPLSRGGVNMSASRVHIRKEHTSDTPRLILEHPSSFFC